jgi:hypothetical protein
LKAEITPTTPSGCEVADVDHLLDLAQALGEDLPGLQGHQASEVGLGGPELLAEEPDQLPAPRCGHTAPGQEGGVRRANPQ